MSSVQSGYVICTEWLCHLYRVAMSSVQIGYVICTDWLCHLYRVAVSSVQMCLQIPIGCHSETPHITPADTKVEAEPDKFSVLCLR
jgi:hypothetical protein